MLRARFLACDPGAEPQLLAAARGENGANARAPEGPAGESYEALAAPAVAIARADLSRYFRTIKSAKAVRATRALRRKYRPAGERAVGGRRGPGAEDGPEVRVCSGRARSANTQGAHEALRVRIIKRLKGSPGYSPVTLRSPHLFFA